MTEFDTEAVFQATIDPQSLRDVRRTVEDEVGDLPVDVQMQATGGGPGGGRDWEIEHDLSRERNFLLRQLLDAQQEGNFDRALRGGGGLGGGLGLGLLGAAGIAGLGGLLSGLGDFELQPPDIPPLDIPTIPPLDAPDSIPLNVPTIPPLEVPDIPPLEVPDIPPIPVDAPEFIPLRRPGETPSPSPGPSPEPTPPELNPPETPSGSGSGGGSDVPSGFPTTPPELNAPEIIGGAAFGAGGALAAREAARRFGGGPRGTTAAAPIAAPSLVAAQTAQRGQTRENPNVIERFFANLTPNVGGSSASTAALTAENPASASRTQSINVQTEVRVDGTDRREVEQVAEQKAQEAAEEIRRNLRGGSF